VTKIRDHSILFVVNSLEGGGAENSIRQVTSKLISDGIPVFLCALNKSEFDSTENRDSHVRVLNRKWKDGTIQTFRSLQEFQKLLLEIEPEVIIANCELPELFVALSSSMKSKILVVEHTSNPWDGRRLLGTVVRFILRIRSADWVTVSSNQQKVWNGSNFPQYIANPINIEDLSHVSNKHRKVVFIGRLRPEKRPEWAIASALEAGLSIELFGDGSSRDDLEAKYVDESESVTFHGFAKKPWREISKDSIVVLPSVYEGDGMVAAEAIIRGQKILLADNLDLRRFNLPDENYFKTQGELTSKLKLWDKHKGDLFAIPEEVSRAMRNRRDIEIVVEHWKLLLNHESKLTNGEQSK
jgi:glycosyltransferase involved in cell wall biosynthesis